MKNNEFAPNELSQEAKASMRTRIISAVVGIVIAVPLLFLGDFFFFALIGFITIVGTYEIVHCAKKKYNPALYIVAIVLALLLTYWPIIIRFPISWDNTLKLPLLIGDYILSSIDYIYLLLSFL